MELIITILVNAVGVLAAAYLMRNVDVEGFGSALIVAVLLSVANAFVKPVLILVGLPVIAITFGLFILVINGLIIWLVSQLSAGFRVKNFGTAIVFSVVLWLINMVLFWLV